VGAPLARSVIGRRCEGSQVKNLTLDTNCLYELENPAPSPALARILDCFHCNEVRLRVPAMAASERQRGGGQLANFGLFRDRVSRLGLQEAELLRPIAYSNLCYADWCVASGPALEELERAIHGILFPTIAFDAALHCPPSDSEGRSKWRNAKCDVQSMWCHIHYGGDIYVTRDANFLKCSKKPRLEALGARVIATPEDALHAA